MRRRLLVVGFLCLIASGAQAEARTPQFPPDSYLPTPAEQALAAQRKLMTEDIAPIVEADERRRAALNANDADALGALLSEDLVYIHSNGLVDGRRSYIDRVRARPGRYRNLTVTNFRVRRNGSTAICDGEVRFEHGVAGGPTIVVKAHFLAVWRDEGGTWRLAGYASPAIT